MTASRFDTDANDMAAGLSNCITRNGQSPATSNIPFGGFRLTGVAVGVNPTDAANVSQIASFNVINGDGVTDMTAALVTANALGQPIKIVGILVINTATFITVPLVDTINQLFSTSSLVTIANGLPVRPEWFGLTAGCVSRAITALPATGGTVIFRATDYNMVGIWRIPLPATPNSGIGNTKANVMFVMGGTPLYASDGSRFASGSGTVFQGSLVNYADNFEIVGGFGVDCGAYVVGLNSGAYMDGCVAGTHQLTGDGQDLTTYIKGVKLGGGLARVLIKAPVNGDSTTYKHGFLFEHIINGVHGNVEVRGGYHGYAHKSVNTRGGHVWVYEQGIGTTAIGDGYIFKSDQYTLCDGLKLESMTLGRKESTVVTPPGYIESTAGYITNNVSIGSLNGIKCGTLMAGIGAAVAKTNFTLGRAVADQVTGAGLLFDANFVRVTVGEHCFTNTSDAGIWTLTSCQQIDIGSGSVTNAANDGYRIGGDVSHGNLHAINNTGYGVNRSTESVIVPDRISGSGNSTALISSAYVGLNSSAFVNAWIDSGGAIAPFQAILVGRTINFRGTIKNGTAGLVGTLPTTMRPAATLSFITVAVTSGGTRTFAHVDVAADGTITVANYATLAAGCTVAFNFQFLL